MQLLRGDTSIGGGTSDMSTSGKGVPAKITLAAMMRAVPSRQETPATPTASSKPKLIHWPIVAAATLPCAVLIGVVMLLLAQYRVERVSAQAMRGTFPNEETIIAHRACASQSPDPVLGLTAQAELPEASEPSEPVFKPFVLPVAASRREREPAPALTSESAREEEPEAPPAKDEPTCQRFGTAVDFATSPVDALVRAGKEQKLLFLLHISGNFDDSKFT